MVDKIGKCPICSQGYVEAEFTPGSLQYEPYLHKLPDKIYCKNCETEFSSISLENGKIVRYEVKQTLKQKYEELKKKYESLQKTFDIVYDDLTYMNVYRCKKCGHYSMVGWVCHECGADSTEMEGDNV